MDQISIDEFVSVLVPGDRDSKIALKTFVESKKLTFGKGLGFYQLTKPEVIQPNKEVLVQRLSDPKIVITGQTVREVLGIDQTNKGGKYTIDEKILEEFNVFVQSTSYNRNLTGGTTFLYRKDETAVGSRSTSSDPSAPKRPRNRSPSPVTASLAPINTSGNTGNLVPGNSNVEIVFSFDTTGSMYPCLSTVRGVIRDTLNTLIAKIPNIRIGILAHGDYDTIYTTQAANNYRFCSASEVSKLIEFVTNAGPTGGQTFRECYELVLREVGTKFNWSAGSSKSLVLIGDASPHEANDNPDQIDWRVESLALKEKGIRVYTVQALNHGERTDQFYREVAHITMGFHLRLHQFSNIADFLTAVSYHAGDDADSSQENRLRTFEEEVSSSGRMVNNLRGLFDQLQGRTPTVSAGVAAPNVNSSGLAPISPTRFQVLTVDEDKPIKQFAQERGLVFKVGRGFYEFTRPESVSDKKEIVLMDKTTGDFYTGWAAAREFSGIRAGVSTKQTPQGSDKYIVFIQSSSHNRKLIAGQRFLYEVDMGS